jgi:heptose I phosphotransferase
MIYIREDLKDIFPRTWSVDDFLRIDGKTVKQVVAERKTISFELHGRSFFLKSHFGVGWKEIWKNLLQLRLPVLGARNEWEGIRSLECLGIPTMKIAAFGQEGRNPARMKSFIITDALQHTEDLESWLPTLTENHEHHVVLLLKWSVIRQVARISRKLHTNGINHRDFYLCHLRIDLNSVARETDQPQIYVMDLHRVAIRRQTPSRWVIKDIAGLLYSALHAPRKINLTRNDFLRFVSMYDDLCWRQSLIENRYFWKKVLQRVIRTHRKGFSSGLALPVYMNQWLEQ